jgi:hypothetical protein
VIAFGKLAIFPFGKSAGGDVGDESADALDQNRQTCEGSEFAGPRSSCAGAGSLKSGREKSCDTAPEKSGRRFVTRSGH